MLIDLMNYMDMLRSGSARRMSERALFLHAVAQMFATLVLPDVGEALLLTRAFIANATPNLTLGLYTNNITPAESDTAGTYTMASGFGYAAVTLTAGSGSVATVAGVSSWTYAQQTWTFTGALGNVYGYRVTDTGGTLFFSERFSDGPYNIQVNNDQIKVTPQFQAA